MQSPYLVQTPVRDEEQYLQLTIDSMVGQTVRPVRWVIINDGSKDLTGAIADRAASLHSWIRAVHRADRGKRDSAGGEIDAFYQGMELCTDLSWDFVVKLDGDLSFEPTYFESCLQEFRMHSAIGIGGGNILNVVGDKLVPEDHYDWHVRGAVKMYRHACWNDINGLYRRPGWDSIDELKANSLGWETRTFRHLPVKHHRYTGASVGAWKNSQKNGLCNYVAGYHPLFMAIKCVRRLFRKPMVVEACGLWWGFLSGSIKKIPQIPDPALIRYVKKQQIDALCGRDSLWRRA